MTPKKISPRKSSSVAELSDLIKKSKSVGVADFKGMTVSAATEIRRAVKNAGGEMKVSKNTLFKIAAGKTDMDLTGLSAFIFSQNDEISALKVVSDFAKKNGILAFKMGLLGDQVLDGAQITALANTPSRETSVSKLMYLLNYHTSKLARTLDAIAKKEVTN